MKKLAYLILALLLPLALNTAWAAPEQQAQQSADNFFGGTITAINATTREISVDKQNFLLSPNVVIHGPNEEERLGLSVLEDGTDIRFTLRGASVVPGKAGVIDEVWLILK